MYFYIFILLLNLTATVKGELSLEVFKDNKSKVPADVIEELTGTNLTLICELVDDSGIYFDDKLSWGKKNKHLQFENIEDLKKLSSDKLILHRLHAKHEVNKALLYFSPLSILDEGTYFCLSLKYKLFKIVKLDLSVNRELENLFEYANNLKESHSDFSSNFNMLKSLVSPRYPCTDSLFTCTSDLSCINNEYVCDGIIDCDDGSDENIYMCGIDPCAGKKHCHNQRCISESMCCYKFKDRNCKVIVRPSCCDEDNIPFHNNFDQSSLAKPPQFDNGELSNFPNFPWPTPPVKPSYTDGSHVADSTNVKIRNVWVRNASKNHNTAIIVIPCIIVSILITICIIVRQVLKRPINSNICRSRTSHNPLRIPTNDGETTPPSAAILPTSGRILSTPANLNNGSGLSNSHRNVSRNLNSFYNPNLDLPPSYDEAMANSSPSAPPSGN